MMHTVPDFRFLISLVEGARAYLYHGTSFYGAKSILQSGKLEASDKRDDGDGTFQHNISLTRDPRLRYYSSDGEDFTGTAPVIFVVNQDVLRRKVKTRPFEYHKNGRDGVGETEEQALAINIPLYPAVVAIELHDVPRGFAPDNEDIYAMGFDPDSHAESTIKRGMKRRMANLYDEIEYLAHQQGIKIIDLRGKSKRDIQHHIVRSNIAQMKR